MKLPQQIKERFEAEFDFLESQIRRSPPSYAVKLLDITKQLNSRRKHQERKIDYSKLLERTFLSLIEDVQDDEVISPEDLL